MKTLSRIILAIVVLGSVAFSQTLADVARQNRQTPKKQAKRLYTNDDIPSKTDMKEAPAAKADTSEEKNSDKKADEKKAEDKSADGKKAEGSDEAKKKWDGYKQNIASQKSAITLLQRELDVATRENQLQIANYYADAGNRLRDPKAFSDQMKKYQDEVDAKTRELQTAKDKLETLLEEARKGGVPASYLE